MLEELGDRAGSIDHIVESRFLRWLGHVARMDDTRLPRLVLFSWLRHPRKKDGQHMTLGRRLMRNLDEAPMGVRMGLRNGHGRDGMNRGWVGYAQDKSAWRANIVETAVGPFNGRVPDYSQKNKKKKKRNQGD